jgi:hypothetical protein
MPEKPKSHLPNGKTDPNYTRWYRRLSLKRTIRIEIQKSLIDIERRFAIESGDLVCPGQRLNKYAQGLPCALVFVPKSYD